MGILFSGDFHLNKYNRLKSIKRDTLKLIYNEYYDKIKYHIMLGDTGFLQSGKKNADHYFFKTLSYRNFPILCIHGDDDPIYGRNDIPEVDIGIGETVLKICDDPFIAYLKRGRIYYIDGMKTLALGGAMSINIEKRKREKRWWKEEYWTEQEKEELFNLLEKDNEYDLVLSHTGPVETNNEIINWHPELIDYINDETSILNGTIYSLINFKLWLCGHWHYEHISFDGYKNAIINYLHYNTAFYEKIDNEIIERP